MTFREWVDFLSSGSIASWLVILAFAGIAWASWQMFKDLDLLTLTKDASEAVRALAERTRR